MPEATTFIITTFTSNMIWFLPFSIIQLFPVGGRLEISFIPNLQLYLFQMFPNQQLSISQDRNSVDVKPIALSHLPTFTKQVPQMLITYNTRVPPSMPSTLRLLFLKVKLADYSSLFLCVPSLTILLSVSCVIKRGQLFSSDTTGWQPLIWKTLLFTLTWHISPVYFYE